MVTAARDDSRPERFSSRDLLAAAVGTAVLADNLEVMQALPEGCIDLIYLDPPFNSGARRVGGRLRTVADASGDRTGFAGRRYRSQRQTGPSFDDHFPDYLAFLDPRLRECRRLLAAHGTLYLHLDTREVHRCKVHLDHIFGEAAFLNEVIWAYDFGGRGRRRWAAKHDSILVYVRAPGRHHFDPDAVDRLPYLAPGLVTPAKRARGKLPTDTWWHTIVPTGGRERTGYPTQKPLAILRRIIQASCPAGGVVADFFAGSGTTGVAAAALGRRFLLVDCLPEALAVQRGRLAGVAGVRFVDGAAGSPAADGDPPPAPPQPA